MVANAVRISYFLIKKIMKIGLFINCFQQIFYFYLIEFETKNFQDNYLREFYSKVNEESFWIGSRIIANSTSVSSA